MKKSILVLAAAMMVAGVASANEPATAPAAPPVDAASAPAAPAPEATAPMKKEKKSKKKNKHGAMTHKSSSKKS
jgi:hypothetical protein